MRLLGLLAVSLSSVNFAAASSSSPATAAVYFFDPQSSQPRELDVPLASDLEFELALAHRLGLSQFWKVGTEDARKINRLSSRTSDSGNEFFGSEESTMGEVVISVAGVKNTKGFLDGVVPNFVVEPAPNSATMDNLFAAFIAGKSLKTKQPGSARTVGLNVLPELQSVPELESNFMATDEEDWYQFTRSVPSEISSKFGKSKETHRQFIRECYLLHNLYRWELNSEVSQKNAFLTLNLQSLQGLINDGDSTVYEHAVALLGGFLKQEFDTRHTIILLPPSSSSSPSISTPPHRLDELKKRREIPISITKSSLEPSIEAKKDKGDKGDGKKGEKVRPEFDGCYKSLSDCEASTSNCSGHGKCNQTRIPYENQGDRKCFKCTCSAEVKKSGRTTHWSGDMCQKQDVSTQFHILIFVTIALIVGIGAGISLLYSIGGEELPGVLTAGPVGKRT